MLLRYPFSVVLFQFLFEGANLATNPKEQNSREKKLDSNEDFNCNLSIKKYETSEIAQSRKSI